MVDTKNSFKYSISSLVESRGSWGVDLDLGCCDYMVSILNPVAVGNFYFKNVELSEWYGRKQVVVTFSIH